MPYRRRASYGRKGFALRPVTSIKNIVPDSATLGSGNDITDIAVAKDSTLTSVRTDVKNGCTIKAIWLSLDFCGLAGTGALQRISVYLFKNPGANLTPPGVFTVGSSNEKKFVIKMWTAMTMRNQDGNPPYHWEGWIKIPRQYQRMGTDDKWEIIAATDTLTGHLSLQAIYKWFI